MTEGDVQTKPITIDRNLAHPPEKIWRALTEPHLIAEWLMQTDFRLVMGHQFSFSAEWGKVDCEILEIDPGRVLAYTWGDGTLDTVVTWTLTPTTTGTLLTMEQTGFRRDQPRYYGGAMAGWPRFLDSLEQVLAKGN